MNYNIYGRVGIDMPPREGLWGTFRAELFRPDVSACDLVIPRHLDDYGPLGFLDTVYDEWAR
jgi:hypothetical protein